MATDGVNCRWLVSSHVQQQMVWTTERPCTKSATEWFDAGVFSEMSSQLIGTGETPVTSNPCAYIWLFTCGVKKRLRSSELWFPFEICIESHLCVFVCALWDVSFSCKFYCNRFDRIDGFCDLSLHLSEYCPWIDESMVFDRCLFSMKSMSRQGYWFAIESALDYQILPMRLTADAYISIKWMTFAVLEWAHCFEFRTTSIWKDSIDLVEQMTSGQYPAMACQMVFSSFSMHLMAIPKMCQRLNSPNDDRLHWNMMKTVVWTPRFDFALWKYSHLVHWNLKMNLVKKIATHLKRLSNRLLAWLSGLDSPAKNHFQFVI